MDRLQGEQLSLIAESDDVDLSPSTDWAIDANGIKDLEYELIRREYVNRANGGQAKKLELPIETSGRQVGKLDLPIETTGGQVASLDPCLPRVQNPLKPLAILPPGTSSWIEIHPRKSGKYHYQRWREDKIKRSRYLGKSL